jgi:hypothetical protein
MRILFLILALALPSVALAGTYTTLSCQQGDVNAAINNTTPVTSGSPQHQAVNGDIIQIATGSCTWTSGISVPANIGITIIGNGGSGANTGSSTAAASSACASGTTITDNISGAAVFNFSPEYGNATTRLSCINMQPGTSTTNPVQISGTCASGGCPNFRMDNLTVPSRWAGIGISDDAFADVNNVFGVADHNTVGDSNLYDNGVDFVDVTFASLNGVGAWGDNSWHVGTALGTNQAFYLENNTFDNAFGTDTDAFPNGGGRYVCRFNIFDNVTQASACTNHGTETTSRSRGGFMGEGYQNTLTCGNASNYCPGIMGYRSGVGMIWGNSLSVTAATAFSSIASMATQRRYRPVPFLYCNGTGPYDVNDGGATVYTGTIASVGTNTLSVSGTPWTANAYAFSSSSPGANFYYAYDTTSGEMGWIASNTSSQLTFSFLISSQSSTLGGGNFSAGDGFVILSTTLYAAGTMTGSSSNVTMTDSTKSWTSGQWVVSGDPYSMLDITQGTTAEIGTSGTDSFTWYTAPYPYWTWNNGDAYAITRASVCLDQPTRSGGQLFSGTVPTYGATTETSSPTYEWMDSGTSPAHGVISADDLGIISGRDYFNESFGQTAQTSATSPSNGTTNGHGTLALRPTTCTSGVGYFATDQGSWNTSGGSNPSSYSGQGILYQCGSGNTWTAYYTPYAYPHPLDGGTTTYSWTPTISPSGGGSLTGTNCSSGSYSSGTTIGACTAVASTGYSLASPIWSGVSGSAACTGSTNPCASFSIAANSAAMANFTINTYTLGVTATNGSVSGSNCSAGTYNYSTPIGPCTATPNSGYSFSGWSGTGSCSSVSGTGTASCTLTSNSNLTASFSAASAPSAPILILVQ